jgi:hypothetical protein
MRAVCWPVIRTNHVFPGVHNAGARKQPLPQPAILFRTRCHRPWRACPDSLRLWSSARHLGHLDVGSVHWLGPAGGLSIASRISASAARDESIGGLLTASWMEMGSGLISVPAALVAILMVKKIDANQEERNEVLARSGEDLAEGETALRF